MAYPFPTNDTAPAGPDDFGREVRRLALDARRILGDPGSPIDELIALHGRVFRLLREAPGAPSAGIVGWLHAVRGGVGERLRAWAAEELPALVALHWRAWSLLHQASGDEAGGDEAPEVDRWVLATRRAIVARLGDRAREAIEAGAA
jgi:hypothetical protein